MIRIPQVRVIDDEGNQLGVMPTPQALEMAQERGFDLVEVAPMAAPPVARFLDFGQYKYELTKREKEAKKRQRVGFKEVRLSPKIGSGDFMTKLHRAVEFLEEGDRIKVTVRFRGRELSHPELGRGLLERFSKLVEEHGVIERQPVLEGKSMFIVLASTHKPKVVETPQRPARPDAAPEAAAAAPAGAAPAAATAAPAAATAAPAAAADPTAAAPAEAAAAPVEATAAQAPAPAKAAPAETEAAPAEAKAAPAETEAAPAEAKAAPAPAKTTTPSAAPAPAPAVTPQTNGAAAAPQQTKSAAAPQATGATSGD
jgi:translation initiation factor IF-3